MGQVHAGGLPVLKGQISANGILPILLLESGLPSDSSAWPALARSLDLAPGETHTLRWVHCARPTVEEGVEQCKRLLDTGWPIHFQKIKHLAAEIPEIETGDPDWNAALAFGYKVALQSSVGPTKQFLSPSFLIPRHPTRGFTPAC